MAMPIMLSDILSKLAIFSKKERAHELKELCKVLNEDLLLLINQL